MSQRQRNVLRAVRVNAQQTAIDTRAIAQAECTAAIEAVRGLQAQLSIVDSPPAEGTTGRAGDEARRRRHAGFLRGQLQQAHAALHHARAQLKAADAALTTAVQAVKAVDVLDARAEAAAARDRQRRAEVDAQDRNDRG